MMYSMYNGHVPEDLAIHHCKTIHLEKYFSPENVYQQRIGSAGRVAKWVSTYGVLAMNPKTCVQINSHESGGFTF